MLIQNIKDIQSNLSKNNIENSLLFSCSVMSNSLRSHGLQHTRLLCPSPSPGICSNSCPLSPWCHPTISSSVVLFSFCLQSFLCQPLLLPSIFPSIRIFSDELTLRLRWPKYCNFSTILLKEGEKKRQRERDHNWEALL